MFFICDPPGLEIAGTVTQVDSKEASRWIFAWGVGRME
jgi:hypothetical protein